MRAFLVAFCEQRTSRAQFEQERSKLEAVGVETISLVLGPGPRSKNVGIFKTGGELIYSPSLSPHQKRIKTINEARRLYLKLYRECFTRLPYKRYDVVLYYGHGGGVRVGAWKGLSPVLSIKEFVEPFLHHNIHGRILITEACYLATLSAVSEMYRIAPYILGTNNFYSGEGALKLGNRLKEIGETKTENDLISAVNALVNEYHGKRIPKYHCFILLRSRQIPRLLKYLKHNNILSEANWEEMIPTNKYDEFLFNLRDFEDEKLNDILDDVVINLPNNPCNYQDLTIEKYAYCTPAHRIDQLSGNLFNFFTNNDKKHILSKCNR